MLHTRLPRDNHPKICLTTYVMDALPGMIGGEVRPAVVVCPGGGYRFLSPREAENMAIWFTARGFHAFVLEYSIVPDTDYHEAKRILGKEPLLDISWALSTIRAHAEEWHVDPDKIAVMGSSAGGHLAAMLGVLWNDPEIVETLGIEKGSNRPNAIVLNYTPVISNEQLLSGSTRKIHGEDKTREEYMALSLERFVGEHTPPCFMWHTLEDRTVPVEHPLLFSLALRKHNIPFELHVFEKGAHGLSTCQADVASSPAGINPETGKWKDLCLTFLRRHFDMK